MRNIKRMLCLLLTGALLLVSSGINVRAGAMSEGAEDLYVDEQSKLNGEAEYMPGEILVSYRPQADEEMLQFTQEMDGDVTDIVSDSDGEKIAVVSIPDDMTVEEAIEEYSQNPDVEYAEPNYIIEQLQEELNTTASEPGVARQWYLGYVKAAAAWNSLRTYNNSKVRVAVIDTGARLEHEDLKNVINKNLSIEVVESNDGTAFTDIPLRGDGYLNGTAEKNDRTTHGTHVAGIVAAQSGNSVGIQGVASGGETVKKNGIVDLVMIDAFTEINAKNEDIATTGSVIYAMQYAREVGCKVINLSLGTESNSKFLERACQQLKNAGITIVCAAGNEGKNISTYPSDYPSTIGVINITEQGERAYTSTYGDEKDLSAPGTNIYSTINTGNSAYGLLSGTSMASPVVAAAAAMLLYAEPLLSPEQVLDILCKTAVDLHTPGKDPETGYGAVDIAAALKRVKEMQNPGKRAEWKRNATGWWYQRADGSYPVNCWEKIDRQWYRFDSRGYMRTGWLRLGNTWYYLKSSGAMAEGWNYVGGKWYYLTPGSGAMRTGWLKLGNTWYYLKSSGAMAEGWNYVGGKWYYLTPGSGAMRTGWYTVNGKWYYSYTSGAMASNTWIGSYYVNHSGVWIR